MLEKITRVIGLSTVFLIILSLFDLNSYYGKFGIPINDYLSSSELLLSFSLLHSTSLLSFVVYLLFLLFIIYIENGKSKLIDAIENDKIGLIEGHNTTKTNTKFGWLLLKRIVSLLIIGLFYYFKYKLALENITHYESARVTLAVGTTWIFYYLLLDLIIIFILEVKDLKYFPTDYRKYISVVILTISLMIALEHKNEIKYRLNINGYAEFDVDCHWENSQNRTVTSDSLIYLGITDNYMFFYDRSNRKAKIKRTSDLIEKNIIRQEVEYSNKRNKTSYNKND